MFGVSFLSPLFLAGIAAAAVPIAIHLFYRRAEPVIEFAAMRYLRQAPVEQARRRRLRELVLLALRVAALALLALAFARPYVSGAAASLAGAATVVLVDTSASMTGPGQFDRVRERATSLVREAPAQHSVSVLSFGDAVDVVAPMSQDRSRALAAVAALKPGAGATRYRAALQRAAEELNGRSGRIVVLTDLQQSGWDGTDAAVPENVTIDVEEVEGPSSNLAVSSLRIEAGEAVAVVQAYSSGEPATEQVIFAADGRRVGAVPVQVPAGARGEARLPLSGTAGEALSASIMDRSGYAADNVRYAVLDGDAAISVLGLTASGHPTESLYLERALSVADGAGGFQFRATNGVALSALEPEALGRVDVIAVLGTRGLEQRGRERLREFVRGGGGLLLTGSPDVEPEMLRQALGDLSPTTWEMRDRTALSFAPDDARHPIFRPFGGAGTLANVRFARSVLLDAPAGARVIARYTDGTPALVEERGGSGRVLIFASDLNYAWNDFPLQPGFVPFVHETLRYLASPRALQSEYTVGELTDSRGRAPGVLRLENTATGQRGRPVAVNVDGREADPRRMTVNDFQAGISRLHANAARRADDGAREREDQQSLWRYGLLLMVVSLAAEGLLGRRLG